RVRKCGTRIDTNGHEFTRIKFKFLLNGFVKIRWIRVDSCSNSYPRTTHVPVFPTSASATRSHEVMSTFASCLVPRERKSTAASTFGPIEPAGNWPSFSQRDI